MTGSLHLVLRRRLARVLPDTAARPLRRALHGESAVQRGWRRLVAGITRRHAILSRAVLPDPAQRRLRAVPAGGRPALAWVVARFCAEDVFAAHGSLVADVLDQAGIAYLCHPVERGERRVIVVADQLRNEALRALRRELRGTGTYVCTVHDVDHVGRPRPLHRAVAGAPAGVRVFRFQAGPTGRVLSGSELGCDLQFWRRSLDVTAVKSNGEPIVRGSLVSTVAGPLASTVLVPEQAESVTLPVDGRPRPVARGLATPHLFSVQQPVDAVYTWVDGSDPRWQLRKSKALGGADRPDLHALATNPSRFESHDELRFSLRSLDMFAPWVRRIYLVTDEQTPSWLDTRHPRITVVDHREIFGERGRLPTFNSHAIESQLHHIPGLAEHFLYINDDVFFGRPVAPSLFFHANGLAKFFPSPVRIDPGAVLASDLPVTSAAKNNRDLLRRTVGRTVTHKFRHTPHALRRSVLYEIEAAYGPEVERTASAQFRSSTDLSISASLAHYYAYETGRAVPGEIAYAYADLSRDDTHERLSSLLRRRHCDVFCLNDQEASDAERLHQHRLARRFLDAYFPVPSQFESSVPISNDPGTGR